MDYNDTDESILGTGLTSRDIEAFSRKVTATASHLVAPIGEGTSSVYQNAMTEIHRELRRPGLQRSVFSIVQNSPREVVRGKLSTSQIQHRALTFIPNDLLNSIPEDNNTFSLFQGFQATLPTVEESEHRKKHRRHHARGQKLLEDEKDEGPTSLSGAKKEKDRVSHKLEMMGIRKSMCSAEIVEIDKKIANLNSMRKIVLDRLADLEDNELKIEQELTELEIKVEEMQELAAEEEKSAMIATPNAESEITEEDTGFMTPTASASSPTFMSQSIYEKLPSPNRPKRGRPLRRKSMPIRHEHLAAGTMLQTIPAHNDMITALDFDAPFGTMVSAALDDTVRVWDLNQGRCLGLLEGHRASVRCLQVEDNLVATGSIDASVKFWDLSLAEYSTAHSSFIHKPDEEEEAPDPETPAGEEPPPLPTANMANTLLLSLEAHVSEITALHFHKQTLVSGSADKTLRQWDLVKGRCVQTLDILWAATQASTSTAAGENNTWRSTSRLPDASADFVGALQTFDAALACGTADGMVRLWDLRSGQVSRNLVGHTGPVTCLQFDDVHLVTGSADRSIRIWDLRTGAIFDAFGYDSPITSMTFDLRHIVSAAGESVVKVYDKGDGHHWDVGAPEAESRTSIMEQVRIKDGFLVGGRRSGEIGLWAC